MMEQANLNPQYYVFEQIDANQDGQITPSELMEALRAAPPHPRVEAAQQDASNASVLKAALETAEGKAAFKSLFDSLDANKDGAVSSKEWGKGVGKNRELMQKYFGGSTTGEVARMFGKINTDGDAKLTWVEWCAAVGVDPGDEAFDFALEESSASEVPASASESDAQEWEVPEHLFLSEQERAARMMQRVIRGRKARQEAQCRSMARHVPAKRPKVTFDANGRRRLVLTVGSEVPNAEKWAVYVVTSFRHLVSRVVFDVPGWPARQRTRTAVYKPFTMKGTGPAPELVTITVHFDPFFQQPPMELEHAPAKPHGAGGGSATAEHAVVLWDPASTDKPKPPTETELRCARLLQRRWRRAQIQAKATAFLDGAGDGVVFGAAAHAFSTAAFGERGKLRMGQKGASQRDVMAYGDMRRWAWTGGPRGGSTCLTLSSLRRWRRRVSGGRVRSNSGRSAATPFSRGASPPPPRPRRRWWRRPRRPR